jgi:large subunit ribosomal protein L19
MEKQIEELTNQSKKQGLPVIKAGDTVRVYQKYKDKDKDKIQMFEGLVLCRKHGNEIGAAITVRKIASGVGVEKIFPLHSPIIDKIEVVKSGKVRRAKLYFMRRASGKKSRLKNIEKKPTIKE